MPLMMITLVSSSFFSSSDELPSSSSSLLSTSSSVPGPELEKRRDSKLRRQLSKNVAFLLTAFSPAAEHDVVRHGRVDDDRLQESVEGGPVGAEGDLGPRLSSVLLSGREGHDGLKCSKGGN